VSHLASPYRFKNYIRNDRTEYITFDMVDMNYPAMPFSTEVSLILLNQLSTRFIFVSRYRPP
jgi:hypothetical protein